MNVFAWAQGWHIAGWTMIYFLATGTLVLLLGATLRFALRRSPPTIRYTTSLAVFAAIALLPIGIACSLASRVVPDPGQYSASKPAQLPVQIELNVANTDTVEEQALLPEGKASPSAEPNPAHRIHQSDAVASLLTGAVEILPWVWIVGTPLTFLLLASGLVGAERLRKTCQPLDTGPLVETCETLQKALAVGRRVGIAVCDRVATPLLVGIVRPLILLPPAALTGWSQAELEMVLLHELAHVRRWDNLVNLAQRVVESLLFFHPAVWIASRWVRRDREDCCDAVVVAFTAKPQAYAELLLSLASPPGGLAASAAMSQHPLAARIRRILNLEDEPMLVSRKTLIAIATGVLSLVLTVALVAPHSTDAEESVASQTEPKASRERQRPEEEVVATVESESTAEEKSNPLFPTLEEQRQADVAYKLLHIELEKLSEEQLQRVQAKGYRGGMRVVSTYQAGSLEAGDLLVGLHVWPTESLEQVNEILTRDDIDQLNPLKFYVIRKQMQGVGGFGPPLGPDQLITSRTTVNLDAWRELPSIKKEKGHYSSSEGLPQDSAATPYVNKYPEAKQWQQIQENTQLLYDGKSFDEWKKRLQTELKEENRIECLQALVAFGREGRGEEVAKMILELSANYNWPPQGRVASPGVPQQLFNSMFSLPREVVIPVLMSAAAEKKGNLRDFALNVVSMIVMGDADLESKFRKAFPDLRTFDGRDEGRF